MADIAVRLEGQRDFRRALRNMGDDLDDLKAAHAAAADIVVERAMEIVPVVTGTLRSTLRGSGTKTRGVARAGFARVPYAGPIHFGWPTRPDAGKGWRGGPIRPQPFLYDAMDDRRGEVLDDFQRRVDAIARSRGLEVRRGT